MFPVPIKRINLDHIRIIQNIVSILIGLKIPIRPAWDIIHCMVVQFVIQVIVICTRKYIAEHVELDCLLSTTCAAKTKTISTLEDLFQSINHKVDISLPIEIQSHLFSYQNSIETRAMIDRLELSDNLISTINHLPCCTYTADVEESGNHQYIK